MGNKKNLRHGIDPRHVLYILLGTRIVNGIDEPKLLGYL
jgi:hypothetical protein